ncbi:MAG TPA: RNA polymerase sigma factor [Polyangia bacterium]|nr:RNA polymerase sigma factor [Polyangia bacterium]
MQLLPAKTDPADGPHLHVVGEGEVARSDRGPLSFREVYEDWFDDVVKWLYALGAPAADTEDLAQEIFLVVRRRLREFDGGNLAGWLYRISQLTVRDHRRRAWFKHLVRGRREIDLTALPNTAPSPERSYETAETRRQFQELVGKMSEKRRTTLVLFEIEGYSGEEIARIQDIPLATVWTRLHHARKEFWKLVREHHLAEKRRA